jgi:circadian clock protein KaiB
MYEFKIYVVDATAGSLQAVRELKALLEHRYKNRYFLKVIDVLKEPEIAEADRVLATPTVIKVTPRPEKRIVGSLSAHEKVVAGLWLR